MSGNHGGSPERMVGEDLRAPSHAERCRTLAARVRSATLSTIARDPAGFPYGSLVAVAVDAAGAPLLCLSSLAEHRQNLDARSEASILLAEPHTEEEDALALGRLTLLGHCTPAPRDAVGSARDAFLKRHPRAAGYVDFTDFAFYRLAVEAIRYVGGFGRMSWVDARDYAAAEPDPLADSAAAIRNHMNVDHAEAMIVMARALASIREATGATMTAVDRYGFEMRVTTKAGLRAARLVYDRPAATSEDVRREVVALVKRARAATP